MKKAADNDIERLLEIQRTFEKSKKTVADGMKAKRDVATSKAKLLLDTKKADGVLDKTLSKIDAVVMKAHGLVRKTSDAAAAAIIEEVEAHAELGQNEPVSINEATATVVATDAATVAAAKSRLATATAAAHSMTNSATSAARGAGVNPQIFTGIIQHATTMANIERAKVFSRGVKRMSRDYQIINRQIIGSHTARLTTIAEESDPETKVQMVRNAEREFDEHASELRASSKLRSDLIKAEADAAHAIMYKTTLADALTARGIKTNKN